MTAYQLIMSDVYRYTGKRTLGALVKAYLIIPGFKVSLWQRICHAPAWRGKLLKFVYLHYQLKCGADISREATIGPGFYIGHFGGIVIGPDVVLGRNCNISQGVTLGAAAKEGRRGSPVVGDNCYFGAGAVVIGPVRIGNNVAVGANAVVTSDVPDNATVVGAPARVINYNGTDQILLNKV